MKSLARALAAAMATLAFAGAPAWANGDGGCFNKQTLQYEPCAGAVDWTGFYFGAHAGYGETEYDGEYDDTAPPFDVSAEGLETNGAVIGAHFGYNHQFDNAVVLGFEIDASSMNGSDSAASANGNATVSAETRLTASARARLGYAIEEFLPYVTAGGGLLSYEMVVNESGSEQGFEETIFGAVAGGGLEFLLNEDVTVRAEGLYYFVEEDNEISAAFLPNLGAASSVGPDGLWMVRGGVSLRF